MMPTILITGGVIAFVLLIIGLVVSTREEKKFVADRLDRFTEDGMASAAAGQPTVSPVAEFLTSQVNRFSWGQSLSRELARADIKLRVGEYILVILLLGAGLAVVAWLMTGKDVLSAVIAGVIGLFIPRLYVGRLKNRRLIHFDEQLGDMLSLMVSSLRGGNSPNQAMETVARELPSPICDEFRRVVQEMQIGLSMEMALDNLTRRIPSNDLDLVVTAINVQSEVGGGLADILDTISETIRERVRIKGEIRALTAQMTFTGRFLSILPVLLAIAMYFLNRSYMSNYFNPGTRWIGIPALILSAGMIIVGYNIMKRIAYIEV